MKKYLSWQQLRIVPLLFAVMITGLVACHSDDEVDGSEYWTVTLDSYQTEQNGFPFPSKYLAVRGMRDNGEEYFFHVGEIEGFNYEEGYRYQLLIKATPTLQQPGTCNPPPYKFKLVKVISKEWFNWCKTW
jgi:hypothetical protein